MKTAVLTILLVLILAFAAFFYFWLYPAGPEQDETAPIQRVIGNKIIYASGNNANPEKFKADCLKRGGQFDPCGSICPPEAEVCAEVCAYTCELEAGSANQAGSVFGKWSFYRNADLGISLEYPEEMKVRESGREANFSYWGPTQKTGTELYDGISLTIRKQDIGRQGSLAGYIAQDISEAELLGEVLEKPATTTIAGRPAFFYRTRTLGVSSKAVVALPGDSDDFMEIVYSSPDPENYGYKQAAQRMINSLSFAGGQANN